VTHFECPLFTLKVNVDSAGGACSHSFFQTAAVDFVADNPGDSLMFGTSRCTGTTASCRWRDTKPDQWEESTPDR
jgi:hypothetical protein